MLQPKVKAGKKRNSQRTNFTSEFSTEKMSKMGVRDKPWFGEFEVGLYIT